MKTIHKRDNYEMQLNSLRVICEQPKINLDDLSNYELLKEIDKRLLYLNCVHFTEGEILTIANSMQ